MSTPTVAVEDTPAEVTDFGPVRFSSRGRIAVITLRRPEVRNAVNAATAEGLEAALDRLEGSTDIWAGVLAAEGPAFCSGADLRAISAGHEGALVTARGGFAGLVNRKRSRPLIACVEGPAVAGGMELVLACDLVVASSVASFGLPEVKRSLIAAGGGIFRAARLLPRNVAMELVMTGRPLNALRAHHLGLVNILTEAGEALPAALALAEEVSANAPLAVRAAREVLLTTIGASDEEGFAASRLARAALVGSHDYEEGPLAFLEKRPAQWTGE